MALIIKGRHNTKEAKTQEIKPSPAPSQQKKKVNPFRKKGTMSTNSKKKAPKDINNDYNFDKNKTYLVVGGKVKEISSKSKYLLDMLIIEKED